MIKLSYDIRPLMKSLHSVLCDESDDNVVSAAIVHNDVMYSGSLVNHKIIFFNFTLS